MTETFRAVEPLWSDDRMLAQVVNAQINLPVAFFTIDRARALRDWLDRAIPPEYPCPHVKKMRDVEGAYCDDCGETLP